ncbi:pfkB family kinase [Amylocarpus encephaloides]|uniref:PfkB family kinase n=1 Tax=Amylocarpus encephaloides TaxID=45428 RepID=A0A9P7YUQ6_9HELO|nr:pfkB family kinase [Amylocarpus encephaloides]
MQTTPSATTAETKCLFVTLGMLVLDELHSYGQNPKVNVIGGSGVYACLGARLYLPPPMSHRLGWLIRTGDDFPHTIREYFHSWNILLLETRNRGQLSTRGELIYQGTTFGPKTFRYTTKPLKIEPRDLIDTPLLSSSSIHFLTSPVDAIDQIPQVLRLRHSRGIEEPLTIIWEPAPPSCISPNMAACFEAVELVDVSSPNYIELAALFDVDLSDEERFDPAIIENLAHKCLAHGIGSSKQGSVIVRAGREGCCIYSRKRKALVWLPAFYLDSSRIVDPTGAGNAFLGDLLKAPVLWNGAIVRGRL